MILQLNNQPTAPIEDIYAAWDKHFITEPSEMLHYFERDKPVVGGFDTETTGLHIRKDKPFLVVFGWLYPDRPHGRVFTFEPFPKLMHVFLQLAKRLKIFMAWQTKFDLHMLKNIGYDYEEPNLFECMAVARLTVESVPARDGGDSMELKEIAYRYVSKKAMEAEKILNKRKAEIKEHKVQVLSLQLMQFDYTFDDKTITSTDRKKIEKGIRPKWTKKRIEVFLNDITNDLEDLPPEISRVFREWLHSCGLVTTYKWTERIVSYLDIYREFPDDMKEYAANDVISMLEFYRYAIPNLIQKNQQAILKEENQLIIPLLHMERQGLRVDQKKLYESKDRLKQAIREKRKKLWKLLGEKVTVNQHERIKQLLQQKGYEIEKSNKKALKDLAHKYGGEVKEIVHVINQLRTLEKWYGVYCLRLIDATQYDGYFYTQLQQCSAVSGRFGSDSQQFPKAGIVDDDGTELFHVRDLFIPPGEEYDSMWYIDFSQVELRVQAHYCHLVSGGDLNLSRAYMPFKCIHYMTGEEYRFDTAEERNRWKELKEGHPNPYDFEDGMEEVLKQGWSVWINPDTNQPWQPTDVHGETTHNALIELGYVCHEKYKSYSATPEMTEEQKLFGEKLGPKEFKAARGKGKTFNFMRNYGGGKGAAMEQLNLPAIVADALIRGYDKAFPGVVIYQKAIENSFRRKGYIRNHYGRRYYLFGVNRRKSYKLGNYNIQGTATGDLMKQCIIKIFDKLKELNAKTKMVLTVHDELVFAVHKDEHWIVSIIKDIMEDHPWCLVPIVAEPEMTTTSWKDKHKVEVPPNVTKNTGNRPKWELLRR